MLDVVDGILWLVRQLKYDSDVKFFKSPSPTHNGGHGLPSSMAPYSPVPQHGVIRRVQLPPGKKLIALTFNLAAPRARRACDLRPRV
jgi:hypothetical protein